MKIAWAALAIAWAAVPAAAQEPNDYQAAVTARTSGDSAKAKLLLLRWLERHPDDVDARLQLAFAELALGNLPAAESGFREVLRLAPEYADARQGLDLIAARRTRSGAEAGHIAVEGALSDLAGGAQDWHEAGIDLDVPIGADVTLGGRAVYHRRFGLKDTELVGRIGVAADRLRLRAHVGTTPNADFRPELTIGAGFDYRLSSGDATVLTFDASYDRFPAQEVVTLLPGAVQYLDEGRAWITLRGIGTIADGGPLQVGALLRGDLAPAEGWRVFAGGSNGPDTDLGVVTRVTSLFGGLEMPLADRFGIAGAVSRDWRRTGSDRTEFRLGLKARF